MGQRASFSALSSFGEWCAAIDRGELIDNQACEKAGRPTRCLPQLRCRTRADDCGSRGRLCTPTRQPGSGHAAGNDLAQDPPASGQLASSRSSRSRVRSFC